MYPCGCWGWQSWALVCSSWVGNRSTYSSKVHILIWSFNPVQAILCFGFYQEWAGKELLFSLPDDRKSQGSVLSWFTQWWVVNSGGDLHCFFLLNVALSVTFRLRTVAFAAWVETERGFLCTLLHGRSSGRVTLLSPPVTRGHIPTVLLLETTGSTGFTQYFRGLMNWETQHLLCLTPLELGSLLTEVQVSLPPWQHSGRCCLHTHGGWGMSALVASPRED